MKTYLVQIASVVEGRQQYSGDILKDLSEEDAKPYLARKVIVESKDGDDDGTAVDAAPSAKPPLATSTKRVERAENAADKKAAEAEEK